MKARVRKTGEIVDVTRSEHGFYVSENLVGYTSSELDFNEENEHWQDVRERAAIAVIQGLLSNARKTGSGKEYVEAAIEYANTLVEELKKK